MTDTCVDGKVQRVQAMLYAKASKEPEASRTQAGRPLSLRRAGCGESSHVRFGSRGMGNYAGRKAGSTSCPYYIRGMNGRDLLTNGEDSYAALKTSVSSSQARTRREGCWMHGLAPSMPRW